MTKVARRPKQNPAIREFILRHVEKHSSDIATLTATQSGLSRAAINNYLKRLIAEGLLVAEGKTKARHYTLAVLSKNAVSIPIDKNASEDVVLREQVVPYMKGVKENVTQIIYHGFTEIFNNAIDHSGSPTVFVTYKQTYTTINIVIDDDGVGIFEKIQKDCGLSDPRTALLELSKGKLTTDAKHHSGEGIFFTSRMFNRFMIQSGDLAYSIRREDDWGWLIETEDLFQGKKGTTVSMFVPTDATWTSKEVFDKYEGELDDNAMRPFSKTHIPIKLGKYGNEQLISRSQAKRLLARFDRFSEIFLDFQGVLEIGQAFADEIFRVFANQHPKIRLTVWNTTPDIDRMIQRVVTNAPEVV